MDIYKLISNYRSNLEKTDSGYTCSYVFSESFPGFDGHFPGNPILPGVIQTLLGQQASLEALAYEYPEEKFTLQLVTRCKFLRPVKPREKLYLNFILTAKDLGHIALCSLSVDGETVASFQLLFSNEAVL
ncbi:3-hydroxyacyl-ACP dehydratase FabZ family protein [Maridesulfovibrio sp. FT414]|uniref:3-hydroxyacyl-ACP dehydratase FabZ family protein n=1 Tax=Maridesulfovibrio sp. FT414 TaxID=2979469 RepID=UPI003D809E8B